MKKKANADVLTILNNFRKMIDHKPSPPKMREELQMMQFKVRPVHGDISQLNVDNEKLLETIWSLGKLDELFQKEFINLSAKEKNVFVRMFDGLYQKLQGEIQSQSPNSAAVFEMEIFREKYILKN